MPKLLLLLSLVLSVCACACGDEEEEGKNVADSACASGFRRTGTGEDDLMHPGEDCNACHSREGEGPQYAIAGTVMPAATDASGCTGLSDTTVEITGNDGTVITLTTNASGNFTLRNGASPALVKPYTAKVKRNGQELVMMTPQNEGACASCHVPGNTGWILAP